jgi:hypothetical protein
MSGIAIHAPHLWDSVTIAARKRAGNAKMVIGSDQNVGRINAKTTPPAAKQAGLVDLALRLLRGFCDGLASRLDIATRPFDGFAGSQGSSSQQGKEYEARYVHDVLRYVNLV